jgi:hypothetical protein
MEKPYFDVIVDVAIIMMVGFIGWMWSFAIIKRTSAGKQMERLATCYDWRKVGQFLGYWSLIYWPLIWPTDGQKISRWDLAICFFALAIPVLFFMEDWQRSAPAG